jgi:hypothetical protein
MTLQRLSKEEFALALQRGQGRALLHVQKYGLHDESALVLEACLHDQAYDPQCEDSRAKWLFDMFHSTAEYKRFSAAILSALASETDTWDLQQLCELASLMAARGDEKAHSALRSRVLQQAAAGGDNWVGAHELVKLDGIDAVVQLARCYGNQLLKDSEANPPPLDQLFREIDIPVHARNIVQELSASEPAIRAYWNYILRNDERRTEDLNSADKIRERTRQRFSLEKILADAANAVGKYPAQYTSFGRAATPGELEIVLQRLETETDEPACVRLLWIFRRVAIPRLIPRLWIFAVSSNEQLRRAALEALAQLRDHSIGEFARQTLRNGVFTETDLDVLELFVLNYQPTDGDLIVSSLRSVKPGSEYTHGIGMSILNICDENHAPQLFDALNWSYENNPCTLCRQSAVAHMIKLGKIESEILEECLHDANEGIQKLAREWHNSQALV